jgi:mRNA interferase MazF
VPNPQRGEVWLVDLGLAAKVRPCLVLSVSTLNDERVLVTVVAHTTNSRETRFEVEADLKFLRPGVFDAQNLITVPTATLLRKLGSLTLSQISSVENAVRLWLGL